MKINEIITEGTWKTWGDHNGETKVQGPITLAKAMKVAGMAPSTSEAKKLISKWEPGLVNGQEVTDTDMILNPGEEYVVTYDLSHHPRNTRNYQKIIVI